MPHHPMRQFKGQWIIVFLILLVAFVFRFQNIGSVPEGLHPLEQQNGQDAITALNTGDYNLFYESDENGGGREGLFINAQAVAINLFGQHTWTLRFVSALAGFLTVLGVYKLTRITFNWQIASIASFLMAISFWHVLFSRLGFRMILVPLFLTWALYYLWKAKQTHHMSYFFMSAFLWGLGLWSHTVFAITGLIIIGTLVVYWYAVHKDLERKKYEQTREIIIRGFALMAIVGILFALPMYFAYKSEPGNYLDKFNDAPYSVIDGSTYSLNGAFAETYQMFFTQGDVNWLHGIPTESLLLWPVSVLFLLGLIRSIMKLAKRMRARGHLSTVQSMLLLWFLVGLIPALWAGDVPNAMITLAVAPVIYIIAAEGLWWIYTFIRQWYKEHDNDEQEIGMYQYHLSEGSFVATFTIVVFLIALMMTSYVKYFDTWADDPALNDVFTEQSITLYE